MKAILEFNLPEEDEDYKSAVNGQRYINAIRVIVDWLKRMHDDSKYETYGFVYEKVFDICNEHGFSPWED